MHAIAHKENDIEALVHSIDVCTSHVYDNLHKHMHISYVHAEPGMHAYWSVHEL